MSGDGMLDIVVTNYNYGTVSVVPGMTRTRTALALSGNPVVLGNPVHAHGDDLVPAGRVGNAWRLRALLRRIDAPRRPEGHRQRGRAHAPREPPGRPPHHRRLQGRQQGLRQPLGRAAAAGRTPGIGRGSRADRVRARRSKALGPTLPARAA
jgi:hypothetical protein